MISRHIGSTNDRIKNSRLWGGPYGYGVFWSGFKIENKTRVLKKDRLQIKRTNLIFDPDGQES